MRAGHPPEFGIAQRITARGSADVHLFPPDHTGLALLLRGLSPLFTQTLARHGIGPLPFFSCAGLGLALLIARAGILRLYGLALGAGLVGVDGRRG